MKATKYHGDAALNCEGDVYQSAPKGVRYTTPEGMEQRGSGATQQQRQRDAQQTMNEIVQNVLRKFRWCAA